MEQLKALDILKKTRGQLEDDHALSKMYDEAIAELDALQAPKICEWNIDDPEWNTYKTGCGQYFNIMNGDLKDNDFKYCSYCGGLINEPKDTL